MKTLDLNAYGVSEMNLSQMQEIEGGCWVCDVIDFIIEVVKDLFHK